jgi:hypothetical protein
MTFIFDSHSLCMRLLLPVPVSCTMFSFPLVALVTKFRWISDTKYSDEQRRRLFVLEEAIRKYVAKKRDSHFVDIKKTRWTLKALS